MKSYIYIYICVQIQTFALANPLGDIYPTGQLPVELFLIIPADDQETMLKYSSLRALTVVTFLVPSSNVKFH
jgi:hypothetical protein